MAVGLYHLTQTWPPKYTWGLILLPLLPLTLNAPDQNLHHDEEAYTYAYETLQNVQAGAIIITATDAHTFALWYVRYGLAMRPDVALVHSHLLAYPWYRQTLQQTHPRLQLVDKAGQPLTDQISFIDHNISLAPLYLTERQTSLSDAYHLQAAGHLQRVLVGSK